MVLINSLAPRKQKRVAIVQSNYIPWKGYFDLIAAVDEFIFYDDRQYTRGDWRNRNQIKTPQGVQWLTVPVKKKGNYHQEIRHIAIEGTDWINHHLEILRRTYGRAPFLKEVMSFLEPIYKECHPTLSDLNHALIHVICQYLNIPTRFTCSWDYVAEGEKTERLIDLCRQAGATEYLSGPLAKNYLDAQGFNAENIQITWFDYEGYPSYPQLWGDFVHEVSILDLLFNCGKEASRYMRYVG
jgi:hypothetical protein